MAGRWTPHWLSPVIADGKAPGCWGHTLSYCEGKLYVVCGNKKSTSQDAGHSEILCLDTDGWRCSKIKTTGPNPGSRDSHTATVIGPPRRNKILVFGGTDGDKKYNELNLLDLSSMRWEVINADNAPVPRESHTATLIDDRVVVFGGNGCLDARENEDEKSTARYLNDLHIFNTTTMTWSSPKTYGKRPRPRESHAAACHEGKLVVFGGEIGDCCLADLHVLDMDSLEWQQMVVVSKTKPKARAGHVMVPHPEGLLLFGGVTADGDSCHDCWVLAVGPSNVLGLEANEAAWRQLHCTGREPSGRFAHAADAGGGALFVYGGLYNEEPVDDLHVLMLERRATRFDVKDAGPARRIAGSVPTPMPGYPYRENQTPSPGMERSGEEGVGEASSGGAPPSAGAPPGYKPPVAHPAERLEPRPLPKSSGRPTSSAGPSISFGAAVSGGKKTPSKSNTEGQHPREGKVTSYNMYCTSIRRQMKEKHTNVGAREIERLIGQQWQMMTMEEKRPYEDAASHQNALVKQQQEANQQKQQKELQEAKQQKQQLMQPPPTAAHSDHYEDIDRRKRVMEQQAELNAKRAKFRGAQDSQSFNSKLNVGLGGLPKSLPPSRRGSSFNMGGRMGFSFPGGPPAPYEVGHEGKEEYGEIPIQGDGAGPSAIPTTPQPRMLGAPITGTVDAMFNSGYLATVRMGGMLYRAVLFSPMLHGAPAQGSAPPGGPSSSAAAVAAAVGAGHIAHLHAQGGGIPGLPGIPGLHPSALPGMPYLPHSMGGPDPRDRPGMM
eukprot:jgi/Tetstr1/446884/TSEL_003664.t1